METKGKTHHKTQVIIVGGGIAGLSLACLLAQCGVYTAIIDKNAPEAYDEQQHGGRTAALMHEGITILNKIGLWDRLKDKVAPLQTMQIIDDSNPKIDPVTIKFEAAEINHTEFGFNIPNNMLRTLLYEEAEKSEYISLFIPHGLSDISHDKKVTAILENGAEIIGDLLIGADGKFSKTRSIFEINYKEIDYKQSAITCLIEQSIDHQNISTEHHRTGGAFTLVPVPPKNGKFYSSIVWIEKTNDAEVFIQLNKDSFENAIEERCKNIAGKIHLISTPEMWPLKAILANKYTGKRMALIAEAAHSMSPIGAQGLNLSMRDVSNISDMIISALKRGEDIGSDLVLERYASARRFDIDSRFYGVDQYNKIVSNNIGLLRGLRRTGLKTLNNIPALKKLAMTIGLTSPQNDKAA